MPARAIAVAENQEQIDKLLEIQKSVPSLATLIYDDPRGLRHYRGPAVV